MGRTNGNARRQPGADTAYSTDTGNDTQAYGTQIMKCQCPMCSALPLPTWTPEYAKACRLRWVQAKAQEIIGISELKDRREAIAALPEKLREEVKVAIMGLWGK